MPCGASRETVRRSELAGWAHYGYCAAHSRWYWGLKLYLITTPDGMPVAWCLADPKLGEREVAGELPAEDIALGYRQLLEVERGWRDLKQVIDLRPACHRKEERIRAHVILCWLALLLARVAENACAATWPELRRQLDRIQVGAFTGPAGTFRQRTEITPRQAAILEQLGIDPPPKVYQLTRPPAADQPKYLPLDTRPHPGTSASPHVRHQIRRLARYTTAEPRRNSDHRIRASPSNHANTLTTSGAAQGMHLKPVSPRVAYFVLCVRLLTEMTGAASIRPSPRRGAPKRDAWPE